MLKKFYKLYHYIATIFYPDVIEEISTNIACWFCDKRLNSQNKISKLYKIYKINLNKLGKLYII